MRFLQAYHRTSEWMYAEAQALAQQARRDFYPRAAMQLGSPGNLALSERQTIELKRMPHPLTEEPKAQLIQVPWMPPA